MERTVSVVPEAGLHARPATRFVETAREYDAEVEIGRAGEDPVPAGSMLSVTGLGVARGEEVRLVADGPDESAALDALEEVLTTPEEGEDGSAESDSNEAASGESGAEESDSGRTTGSGGAD